VTGAARTGGRLLLPVLSRYLIREFARTFALTLTAFVAIFLIGDFFDRFSSFLDEGASVGSLVRIFLYKVPAILPQVTPIAVLASALVALGLLARQNEFVALRACGVSAWQITAPLVVIGTVISVVTFAWNETVVPAASHSWRTIHAREVKKRATMGVFTGREVWYHGRAGFYKIDRVRAPKNTLYGVSVYQMGSAFYPRRLVEIDMAVWDGNGWTLSGVRTREFGPDGVREVENAPAAFSLPETIDDFKVLLVEPEELSYSMLRRHIRELGRKGVDSSEDWVDLHLKLALPAASVVMMLVAAPLMASGSRVTSLAPTIGLGFVLGFTYFFIMAFTRALGQSGALPAAVAAWSTNTLFALLGGYFLLGSD